MKTVPLRALALFALGSGKNGRLYKRLMRHEKLATHHVLAPGGVLVLVGDGKRIRKALEALVLPAQHMVSPDEAMNGALPR